MTNTRTAVEALLFAMLWSSSSSAQEIRVARERLRGNLETDRINAFYAMVKAADDHDRRPQLPPTAFLAERARSQRDLGDALIQLLERENGVIQRAPTGSLSGDYLGVYYTDLVVTVARMQDRRAIHALIPGIAMSDVVRTTIADFGDDAVVPLLQALKSADRDTRAGAVLTLKSVLARRSALRISDSNTRAARGALLHIARSRDDAFIRASAVEALGAMADSEIRATMRYLADSDAATGYARPGEPVVFPVRSAASIWLARHR